jgi:hypothetical protein
MPGYEVKMHRYSVCLPGDNNTKNRDGRDWRGSATPAAQALWPVATDNLQLTTDMTFAGRSSGLFHVKIATSNSKSPTPGASEGWGSAC